MRYHFERPQITRSNFGKVYHCDHPLYDSCTLYLLDDKGLAVIQQRCVKKKTFWTEIDHWLTDPIYLNPDFYMVFQELAGGMDENGLYPTITVRTLMHKLRMKPIPKEKWETVFDRTYI